tara:strand:+ start:1276 stop:1671 length:396 start_codon:yes stop_codon:yes gene_type:complete
MKNNIIKNPSNKKFGFFFSFIFFIFGAYFYDNHLVSYTFLILSFLFSIVAVFKSNLLSPLNKTWMHLGLLIGKVVSPIVLALIFFGLFTPISFFMLLLKRDELNIRPNTKKSYWKYRDLKTETTGSFENQY